MMTHERTLSADAQRALKDMVELQMYLVAQPQQTAWPMLPRSTKAPLEGRVPGSVEKAVATELNDRGFIEPTSSRTFVVSKSGLEFYEREMRPGL